MSMFARFAWLVLLAPPALSAAVVLNRGVPGQNTAEIDARTIIELKTYSPDVVVLFAGMNDAVNDKKFLAPEISGQHVGSIVRACQRAKARIVLVTVHQPDVVRLMQRHSKEAYGDQTPEQRIRSVNASIVEVAATNKVPIVDFYQVLEQHGGANTRMSTDGVHLTAEGYALLARAVAHQLRSMNNLRTIVCLGDSLTFGIGVRQANTADTNETYPGQLQLLLNNGQ